MQKTLQAQQDALKEKLLAEIDLLKHRISDSENRYSDLNKLYADSEAEKSKLNEEMETKKEDFEIL
jgi:chromosome segregation ATPase